MDLTSIVLPAYVPNAELKALTRKCLASLEATTPRDAYELIVVDNGSSVTAAGMLANHADLYIRTEKPIGYARAANIGLAAARCDWLLVLNTDIEFTQEAWLEQLQADYLNTPGGILSAMDDESRTDLVFDESWFSCWLTLREVIEDVGYFDESLPFRFHDQDYAIKVTRAGYRVMRTGNVQVKHIDSATYSTMGRNEDPKEAAEMRRRWGAVDFADWLRVGQPGPAT